MKNLTKRIGGVDVLIGDALETLVTLPDNSINCCVTSPPYFNLRDYNEPYQLGLEDTPTEYINKLVEIFRQVKRVLTDDGTFWLNIGDSYAQKSYTDIPLKAKDLMGIPWRVAFALQADGWYLRQDIIWSKGNPMPESVKDRCTKSHEYIFLLTKNSQYTFDADAIKERCSQANINDFMKRKTLDNKGKGVGTYDEARPDLTRARTDYMPTDFKRNKRSVWNVNTKPYKGAHFATFPVELITPCILSGCPEGGVVLDPFGGSGTTAGVALRHKRKAIMCEINEEYVDNLMRDRILSIALT